MDRLDRGDFWYKVEKKIVGVQIESGEVGSFGGTGPRVEISVRNRFEDTVNGVGCLEIPFVVVSGKFSEVDWSPANRDAKGAIVDVNVVDSWPGRILRMTLWMGYW